MLKVFSSTSTNTGDAPVNATASPVALNVNDGQITASPWPMFLAISTISSASVPLAQLTTCFAPLKAARLDYVIQKATEMGVSTIQPVITRFTQLSRVPLDRMRANALANDTLSYLVQTQGRTRALAVRGGLAPHVCRRIAARIDAELHLPLSLGQLAAEANLSEFHFARMFRASFGVAPHEWVMQQRMARAQTLLRTTTLALATIAERCGFASASHFSRRFSLQLGASPSRYRQAWQRG